MFKVGDVIRAKAITPYAITTDGWTGTVLVIEGNNIFVDGKNGRFWVEAKYFELVKPAQIKEENKMDFKNIVLSFSNAKLASGKFRPKFNKFSIVVTVLLYY